ncbi:hypothetical protein [Crocinitomix catalasitica]|uniref:hypothetical protein n=1 Tax=Crocinitomix catalasitica TaxID=184607 RepID=UPI0004851379|nr:hypothetical protein [Crocinitomix catalasitica]
MNANTSIYEKIIVKEVTFETGDNIVKAKCDLVIGNVKHATEMLITHTDLNRIIAKLSATGFEFKLKQNKPLQFADGTEIIDYSFENVFGAEAILENFYFTNNIQQIRA